MNFSGASASSRSLAAEHASHLDTVFRAAFAAADNADLTESDQAVASVDGGLSGKLADQQGTLNAAHIDQILNGNSSRRRPMISQYEPLDGLSGS